MSKQARNQNQVRQGAPSPASAPARASVGPVQPAPEAATEAHEPSILETLALTVPSAGKSDEQTGDSEPWWSLPEMATNLGAFLDPSSVEEAPKTEDNGGGSAYEGLLPDLGLGLAFGETKAAEVEPTLPEIGAVRPGDTIYDDGKSKMDLQDSIDSTMAGFEAVPVTVMIGDREVKVTVESQYRNIKANDDWLGAKGQDIWYGGALTQGDGTDGREHSRSFSSAYGGKANPAKMGAALQEEVDGNAELQKILAACEDEAAAEAAIQSWAKHKLGIDCSGFVWHMLNDSGQYNEFTPVFDHERDQVATSGTQKLGYVNAKNTLDSATELADPGSWRPMDLVGWDEHIMMIYDSVPTEEEGIWEVTLVHSAMGTQSAESGPTREVAWYDSVDQSWRRPGSGDAHWIDKKQPSVRRAVSAEVGPVLPEAGE